MPGYLSEIAATGPLNTTHKIWQGACTELPIWPSWPCMPIVFPLVAAAPLELVSQFLLAALLPVDGLWAPQD